MITKALYPGSFDPLTMGHLNIIRRAAKLYDELTIGVISNPAKEAMFSLEEREDMLKAALKDLKNVKVDHFSGLLADYVNRNVSRIDTGRCCGWRNIRYFRHWRRYYYGSGHGLSFGFHAASVGSYKSCGNVAAG